MTEASRDWRQVRDERRALAWALLQREETATHTEAFEAFRRRYPLAPEEMIRTAVHHVFVDGPDAVIGWLADAELFLRDPQHNLSVGVSWNLLHHVYNWYLFMALLPEGKPMVLDLLDDLKQFAEEGALDAVKQTVQELRDMFDGDQDVPECDKA